MKKINSPILAPIVLAVFFGGILVSMGMNLWVTESSKVAARYTSGEYAGTANPADIRGSYSLANIEENFGIPVAVTARAFGAETWPNPPEFKAKDLEALYAGMPEGIEVGTDSVRLFVARYLGQPYTPEETTRLPRSALTELKAKLSPADMKAMEKYVLDEGLNPAAANADGNQEAAATGSAADTGAASPESTQTAAAAQPATGTASAGTPAGTGTGTGEASEDDRTIKGKTTFNDLLSWGVSRTTIETIMGMTIPAMSVTIRDFCLEKGLEFSDYRTPLQEAVPAQ